MNGASLRNYAREGFELAGDSPACLLIHGLCGSPAEMFPLGRELNRRGHHVYAFPVAGHGQSIEALDRTVWRDWTDSAQEAYRYLEAKKGPVILVGHSMGAVLALHLATLYQPAALVLLSPALYLNGMRWRFAGISKYFQPYVKFQPLALPLKASRFLRGYPLLSIHGLHELKKMSAAVRRELHGLQGPALVVHSVKDEVTGIKNVTYLEKKLGNRVKELILLEESGHMILLDRESEQVYDAIFQFIQALPG